jgi:hypothetical protein
MYELAKIFVANGHKVGVLTRPVGIKHQFYYSLLMELGCSIHKRLVTLRHLAYILRWLKIDIFPPSAILKKLYIFLSKFLWWSTVNDYDSIYVIGMETYCDSFGALSASDIKSIDIEVFHVMHKFQQERDYSAEFNLDEIVVIDQKQEKELKKSMPKLKIKRSSLFVDFDFLPKFTQFTKSNFDSRQILNIGVISRLTLDRPNEVIFRYFAVVKRQFKVYLHWYGAGNPHLYDDLCKSLLIDPDDISFHGHTSDINADLDRDLIDLCWQTCMGSSLNYAPIELMGMCFPVYLINIDPDFYPQDHHPCQIARTENEAIDFHKNIVQNPHYLNEIILNNRDYVTSTYGVDGAYVKLKQIGIG